MSQGSLLLEMTFKRFEFGRDVIQRVMSLAAWYHRFGQDFISLESHDIKVSEARNGFSLSEEDCPCEDCLFLGT